MPIWFELRYLLKGVSIWITALVIAAVSALGIVAFAGEAQGSEGIGATIERLLGAMLVAGTLVGGLIATSSALRSQTPGFLPVRLSTASGNLSYAFGQLIACALLIAGVVLVEGIGIASGLIVTERLAELCFNLRLILASLSGALAVSLMVAGGAFALATRLRSAPWAHIFTTACFVVSGILVQFPAGLVPESLLALDPSGILSLNNVQAAIVDGADTPATFLVFAAQRVIWLVAAMASVALAVALVSRDFRVTRPPEAGGIRSWSGRWRWPAGPAVRSILPGPAGIGTLDRFRVLWRSDLATLSENKALYGFALMGLVYAGALLASTALLQDPPRYPTNATVIQALKSSLSPTLVVIAAFCGSELVWRGRLPGWASVSDSYPVSNGLIVMAKAGALASVLILVIAIAALAAFIGQALLGQSLPRLTAYIGWLILPLFVQACVCSVGVLACHTLAPNRILGWLFFGVLVAMPIAVSILGGTIELAAFGQSPTVLLTDMNGLRGYGQASLWFSAYWLALAGFLLVVSALFWRRGDARGRWTRWLRNRRRSAPQVAAAVSLLIAWGGLGLHVSGDLQRGARAQDTSPPTSSGPFPTRLTVRSVQMSIDLYPETNRLSARGVYRLRNETAAPVMSIEMVFPGRHVRVHTLAAPRAVTLRDRATGVFLVTFADALVPGEEIDLSFRSEIVQAPLQRNGEGFEILGNGAAVLDTQFAPFFRSQVSDAKGEDFAIRPVRALPDRDLVMTDISVSTRSDQHPLAIGKAVSEGVANGRRTVRYVSEAPVPQMIGVQSGAYSVLRRSGAQGDVSVYFHPEHAANSRALLASLQESFDAFAQRFGAIPRTQLRIVEVAGGFGSVQSLPNTLLFSERSSALSSDLRKGTSPDFPSLQVAHEVAHQWWGQDLRVADLPGASLVTESVAQYAALSFIQGRDGRPAIGPYLFRMNRAYFRAAQSHRREAPLSRAGAQDYLRYDKGGLALFLIADQIGEPAMDQALKALLEQARARPGTLVSSSDLIRILERRAAPHQRPLVRDLLEDVVIYDLRAVGMRTTRLPDGRFDVIADIHVERSSAAGGVSPAGAYIGDVEVSVSSRGDPRRQDDIRRFPLKSGDQRIRFIASERPDQITVDPRSLWIDPERANNTRRLE